MNEKEGGSKDFPVLALGSMNGIGGDGVQVVFSTPVRDMTPIKAAKYLAEKGFPVVTKIRKDGGGEVEILIADPENLRNLLAHVEVVQDVLKLAVSTLGDLRFYEIERSGLSIVGRPYGQKIGEIPDVAFYQDSKDVLDRRARRRLRRKGDN